jgi:transcriptional regulator with XRE-family HTH domain
MAEPVAPLTETASYRSRQIDPAVLGQRIRAARLAAGLTQSGLARPYTSAAYISRIESGQRRPSDLLLRRIALAVNRTVDDLLFESGDETRIELRLRLSRAEWLMNHDGTADALAIAHEVTVEATTIGMPELAARAQTLEARCWLASDKPAVAADLLERLIGDGGQGVRSVRTLASLAQAYVRMGAPYRAIKAAASATDLVVQFDLQGLPEALEVALAEAGAHIELGQRTKAADICRRAIEEAALTGQSAGLKEAYWRASQTESERGSFEQAWNHAEGAAVMSEVELHGHNLRLLQEKLIELSADGS